MASMCFFSCSVLNYKSYHERNIHLDIYKPIYSSHSRIKAITAKAVTLPEPNTRRSGNFAPSSWSFDDIQSLSSEFIGEDYKARANILKNVVKTMIPKDIADPLNSLELVDDLQRLGISYHFEDEIRNLLEMIYSNYYKTQNQWNRLDLNLKALGFRLLRQHGYEIPQEIFHNFKDQTQNLKPHILEDMIGMLNLYEASYHSFEDESILDDARDLTSVYLKDNQEKIDKSISSLVTHALELPLHMRVPRIETKWFIQVYENRSDMNPTLLELAKLDFDMLQALHIEDLKQVSRWWRNLGWDKKLSSTRDRLVHSCLWATCIGHLPQYSLGRITITKIIYLVTVMDDVYDLYATLDELEQFTDVLVRWDINAIEELPDYMKICYVGFYNSINEIAYDTLTDTGFFSLPYLKKAWADLFKSWLLETRRYNDGYKPTLKEYLDNASVSVSNPVILMHAHFVTSVGSSNEILQCMERLENIVHYSSLIFRLANDLGSSADELVRGDTSKSVECYMHDSGATEEEGRRYIKELIMETWKKLNKERTHASSQFSREFIEYATNIARMAQFMYKEGDGHSSPEITKFHVSSVFCNPIQGTK